MQSIRCTHTVQVTPLKVLDLNRMQVVTPHLWERKEVVRIVSGCRKKMSDREGVRSVRTEKS
jgi:hypothetical protein